MVSEYNPPRPPDEARSDADRMRDGASREGRSAREEAGRLADEVKEGASRLSSGAREKAYEQAEAGKSYAAGNIDDFTAAIRKASDELGERDQSMAANLVREAASGLEQVSGAIQGKSVQELTRSVAGFARRQPAAFLIGAALAGVALGRFARASSEHDDDRDELGDRSAYGRAAGSPARAATSRNPGPQSPAGNRFAAASGSSAASGASASSASTASGSNASASTGGPAGAGTPGAGTPGAPYRSAASTAGLAGMAAEGPKVRPGAVSEPGTTGGDHDR